MTDDKTHAACSSCGSCAELRPYGPSGAWICFDCGMKDIATTSASFASQLDAAGSVSILTAFGPVPHGKEGLQ